jgi:Integrase zinc binding domain/Chromo (CHRromatin Organisation MOdifier) domain
VSNGLLLYQNTPTESKRVVVPANEELRHNIVFEHHDTPVAGHLGRDKTQHAVARSFWWNNMHKFIDQYVHHCDVCQRVKPTQCSRAPLQSLPIPPDCWNSVSMDFIFGFPRNNQKQTGILVFVCRLSKMVHLAPCSESVDAEKSARLFVDHVFRHHGLPETLISDRDPRFTSRFWQELFSMLGTRLTMSTARHPETDGQTERVNRVVEDVLRSFCAKFPRTWGSLLPLVEFAINNAVHQSTGYTPFFVNSLRHPRVPTTVSVSTDASTGQRRLLEQVGLFLDQRLAVLKHVQDTMAKSQDLQKRAADRHGRRNLQHFAVGDRVLLSTAELPKSSVTALMPRHVDTKLLPRFVGPFTVSAKISDTAYELELPPTCDMHPVFYVGLLKRYLVANNPPQASRASAVFPLASSTTPEPPTSVHRTATSSASTPSCDEDAAVAPATPLRARPNTRAAASRAAAAHPSPQSPAALPLRTLRPRAPRGTHSSTQPPAPKHAAVSAPALPDSTPRYQLERLVAARSHHGQRQLRVRWTGFPPSSDTWEPRSALLEDVPQLVRQFEKRQGRLH